jgi:hypothetical protein
MIFPSLLQMASSIIPSLPVPVPVQSPNLVVYPAIEEVVLKASSFAAVSSGSITTSGSAQRLVNIPVAALGVDLLTSDRAILFLETSQDLSGTMLSPIGYSFRISPNDNLSNITTISRDYTTALDPAPLATSSSLLLSRSSDYPPGTSNISVFLTATTAPGFNLTTSNVMNYSYSLTSLA